MARAAGEAAGFGCRAAARVRMSASTVPVFGLHLMVGSMRLQLVKLKACSDSISRRPIARAKAGSESLMD